MDDLESELAASSDLHAAYLRMLEADGFTRVEAFALVRDHHALLSWAAITAEAGPPPWLGSPHQSSESSATTAASLRLLKPRTPEA